MSRSGQKHGLGRSRSKNVHIAGETPGTGNERKAPDGRDSHGNAGRENVGNATANASCRKLLGKDGSGPDGASIEPVIGGQDIDKDDLMRKSIILRAIERAEKETDLFDDSSTEEIPHVFSAEYEARKQKMMLQAFGGPEAEAEKNDSAPSARSAKRIFRMSGKIAAAAACLAIILIGARLFTVDAVAMPEPIRKLMVAVQEQFSSSVTVEDILFGDNKVMDYPITIETKYEPTVTADGYWESDRDVTDRTIRISYENTQGKYYIFSQITAEQWNSLDTENIQFQMVYIENNVEGIIYTTKNTTRLIWADNEYIFSIYGDFGQDILKQLAASVEVVG